MSELLTLSHVSKAFGGVQAIDDFSLSLHEGAIHGLIGPNGAGKTTIFNTITGIYRPDGGEIRFDGKVITDISPHEAARLGIARTFQNIRLFGNLSVAENVEIARNMRSTYSLPDALLRTPRFRRVRRETAAQARDYLEIVGLSDRAGERADSLPYGHQRKLEIARAMATEPKLLLLDEPAAGMNEEESAELVDFIFRLRERFKVTVLLIEHHMDVVARLCETCTVLNFGRTLASGPMEAIRRDPEVVAAYLGGDEA
ncbi:MAG: ABC transporter ATP-binding protein [Clostridia bacterium]|nr:ABC transporter ATP-binding protein [Clostridia bacterium]